MSLEAGHFLFFAGLEVGLRSNELFISCIPMGLTAEVFGSKDD
jgi:hypothetical protein